MCLLEGGVRNQYLRVVWTRLHGDIFATGRKERGVAPPGGRRPARDATRGCALLCIPYILSISPSFCVYRCFASGMRVALNVLARNSPCPRFSWRRAQRTASSQTRR